MRYLIIPLAAALLASACDSSGRDSPQAEARRAENIAKVERLLADGPQVVSEVQIEDGKLMTISVPQKGLVSTAAQVSTCLLFIHQSGASSMSCPGEPASVWGSDL
jgi:hypothetical protein